VKWATYSGLAPTTTFATYELALVNDGAFHGAEATPETWTAMGHKPDNLALALDGVYFRMLSLFATKVERG
jgi:hypothetical protein